MIKMTLLLFVGFSFLLINLSYAGGFPAGVKLPFAIRNIVPPIPGYSFELLDPNNKPVKLKDYKGKVLLLNFWATWCIPCVREMPDFQALLNAMEGENFAILGINVMDSKSRVERFLKKKKIDLPIALDTKGVTYPKYNVRNFPTTLILDKEGREIGRTLGIREWHSPESIEFFKSLSRKL